MPLTTSQGTGRIGAILRLLALALLWFGGIMLGLSALGVVEVGWSKVAMMVMLYALAVEASLVR